MKRFCRGLWAAMVFVASGTAMAEGYRSVRVELKEGEALEVQLSESLRTKFTQEYMTFTDGIRIVVKVPRGKVSRLAFQERDAASINEIGARFSGDGMNFSGLPAGSTVRVVNAAGRQVMSQKAEGDFSLNLNQFAPGVYMVTVNGITYKVQIR